MREVYIKDKVTYLTESYEAIHRMRRSAQVHRIVNTLHQRMCDEHRRMEEDFAGFAYRLVGEELI